MARKTEGVVLIDPSGGATREGGVEYGRTPNGARVVSYGLGLWFLERHGREPLRISINRAARLCAGYGARTGLRGGERFDHFVRVAEASR